MGQEATSHPIIWFTWTTSKYAVTCRLDLAFPVNSLASRRWVNYVKGLFCKKSSYRILARVLAVKLLLCKCHRISLISRQHWFRFWFGAVRQQAVSWTRVGADQSRHTASLGHYELSNEIDIFWNDASTIARSRVKYMWCLCVFVAWIHLQNCHMPE